MLPPQQIERCELAPILEASLANVSLLCLWAKDSSFLVADAADDCVPTKQARKLERKLGVEDLMVRREVALYGEEEENNEQEISYV